ncbi:hypothetical protein GCM10010431_73830 [Streptomyces kunmingensis]
MADGAYGDVDDFRCELHATDVPFVMAIRRRRGIWAYAHEAHTPVDAARRLAWHGPGRPGDWTPVTRTYRDGHTATWWAADATLGFWGPDGLNRLVVATTDPATLPERNTWYLVTDLPRPGSPQVAESPHPPASLAEVVRIYGIRNWIEQSYKQVKDELGWADFQVRTDRAIRRHQTLVNCAFSFCWHAGLPPAADPPGSERGHPAIPAAPLATCSAGRPQLADPGRHAAALVESLVQHAPAGTTAGPDRRRQPRPTTQPLPDPALTNHR